MDAKIITAIIGMSLPIIVTIYRLIKDIYLAKHSKKLEIVLSNKRLKEMIELQKKSLEKLVYSFDKKPKSITDWGADLKKEELLLKAKEIEIQEMEVELKTEEIRRKIEELSKKLLHLKTDNDEKIKIEFNVKPTEKDIINIIEILGDKEADYNNEQNLSVK